eukprot:5272522-Pyramimonas_sp.AAC.1
MAPSGHHRDTIGATSGHHVDTIWTPSGNNLDTATKLCLPISLLISPSVTLSIYQYHDQSVSRSLSQS